MSSAPSPRAPPVRSEPRSAGRSFADSSVQSSAAQPTADAGDEIDRFGPNNPNNQNNKAKPTSSHPGPILQATRLVSPKSPWSPVLSCDQLLRLGIVDESLIFDIPLNTPSKPESDIRKVAGDHRIVADLDIRARMLP